MAKTENKTSAAQLAAVKRYRAKTYDTVAFDVPKGTRDKYKQAATSFGLSLAKFLATSADEFIQNHAGENRAANQLMTAITPTIEKPGEVLSREEKKLLEDFRQLPVDSQKHIRGVIRAIIGAQAESD